MATILVNGVFDLLHNSHRRFLLAAKHLGRPEELIQCLALHLPWHNHLIVAINSDRMARELKGAKWGPNYPRDSQFTRAEKLSSLRTVIRPMSSSIFSASYADKVIIFDSEAELYEIIRSHLPCILCKGPDYAGKRVTGDDIAPVIILDTPETDEVREFKKLAYML